MTISKETALKMLDQIDAIRREEDSKLLGGEEYQCRCVCAEIAKAAGFKSRAEWTGKLLEDSHTLYYQAAQKARINFR